mgnify:FL=1
MSFYHQAWLVFTLNALFFIYSGLSVGIYTTNSADAVAYVLQSSGSNVCVVENDAQLKKVLQVWDELPDLKAVVQYSGKPDTDKENVYTVCILDSFTENVPETGGNTHLATAY